MTASKISAVGHYEPKRIVSNEAIGEIYANSISHNTGRELSAQDIIQKAQRVGIEERRYRDSEENSLTMSREAVKHLQKHYGSEILKNIDAIYFGTFTPAFFFPSGSSIIAGRLGINNIETSDIQNACVSFMDGLRRAHIGIQHNYINKALVIGSDVMSGTLKNLDYQSGILFGDAAGAVIVERDKKGNKSGIQGTKLIHKTQTDAVELNMKSPFYADNFNFGAERFNIKGAEVYKKGVQLMTDFISEYCHEKELQVSDFKYIIPHQANQQMLDDIGTNLGYDNEKILKTLGTNGNTASASIPLTLSKYSPLLKKGDRILLVSFGAGYILGLADIIWDI